MNTSSAPRRRRFEVVEYVANDHGQWKQMKIRLECGHVVLRPIQAATYCRCVFCWLGDTTGQVAN